MDNCNCPLVHAGPSLASTCGGGAFLVFMGLLETFIRAQCDIEDPCGRPNSNFDLLPEYDFIIVGGGSAGCVLANRLSEIPEWTVLLIEAGGNEPTGARIPSMFSNYMGSEIDWSYHTEPELNACLNENEHKCFWPRGKVLGGTSVLNGMMYMRGSKADFDGWAEAGNAGWSYDEVLPYFLKSEDNQQIDSMDAGYHAVGGYLTVSQFPYHPPLADDLLQAGRELGYNVRDVNGEHHTGFMLAQTTSRKGSRLSVARAFLSPIKTRPNLHVLLNTTVARVLIHQSTKQAYAVSVIMKNGNRQSRQRIYASKEVIVSGGAVNSPQILLLSGIGPRKHLEEHNIPVIVDLPGVGKNLHNHVSFFVNYFMNETDTNPLDWATAMEYMLHRSGLMAGTGVSQVTALIPSSYATEDHPDLQYFFGGYAASCAKTGQVGEPTREGATYRVINFIPCLLHPKSRGELKLKSNNPLDHPAIYGNYLIHPDDEARMLEAIKIALKLGETPALRKHGFHLDTVPVKGCEEMPFGSDEYWYCALRRATGAENHQAGSCKMGPSTDPRAVVDNQLRVHGVKGLRVADASVMPAVTSGNTNAPVIMIAEKTADYIKSAWLTNGPQTRAGTRGPRPTRKKQNTWPTRQQQQLPRVQSDPAFWRPITAMRKNK